MAVYKNVTKRVYFQSLTTAGADNTGTTPTVKVVKDGGAQATATNTPTHLGTGQWMLVLTATEMNADEVSVNHSASGCVSGVVTVYPEADYTSARSVKLDNADVATSTRMATYTQPTGFLAATFPTGTVANTTNITAGTITTVTAVTGLTASNLDATVSSRSTYAGGAVASVTGNVGGNVTGSVGSVVGLTASNLDATVSSRMASYTQPTGFLAATFPGTVGSSTYAGGAVASVTGAVGSVASGGITTASFAPGAIDNTVLSSNAEQAVADKTLATSVEGAVTLKQILQLIAAACAGQVSGAATTSVTIRDIGNVRNAIVATVDANGNRSATTYILG